MNMKKLIVLLTTGLALSSFGQTGIINYNEQSLINGWNLVLTNGMVLAPGVTNQLFTTTEGQIVYSLTNQTINGIANTNIVAADAFNTGGVMLRPDANGDYNANAAIHVYLNNTNWIPVAVTNSQGQWFVATAPTTNGYPFQNLSPNYVGWPLASSAYPAWQYPATTNLYPLLPSGLTTNILTFTFQSGWKYKLGNTASVTVWSPTNQFQFTWDGSLMQTPGGQPISITTNLPLAFMQGGNVIRCSSVSTTVGSNARTAYILNVLSVGQPQ